MKLVTREEFLAYVGPRDVIPVSRKDHTLWQTRGQRVVGRTTPGYANRWGPNGPHPLQPTSWPSAHPRGPASAGLWRKPSGPEPLQGEVIPHFEEN